MVMPRPPSPTLFPYTTLFRSRAGQRGLRQNAPFSGGRAGPRALGGPDGRGASAGGPARPPEKDRKSTRLNSSHQIISYAVFCLKKKTGNHPTKREGLTRSGAT